MMSQAFHADMPHYQYLKVAIEAAALGCAIAREGQLHDFNMSTKSVGDYVSEIDVKIDHTITRFLTDAFPDIPVISEELCPDFDEFPDECWIVDPLDGTNSYLARARLELVSTMIALRLGGETVVSVVRFPFTDETYCAALGGGAFCNEKSIQVPGAGSKLQSAWVAMNHYGDKTLETEFFVRSRESLRTKDGAFMVTIDPPGSGLALRITDSRDTLGAVVHDNNPKKRKQEIWDVIPIQLIIEEAGGVYLNAQGDQYDPLSTEPIVIAASMSMATEIIRLSQP
ncbi:MAG: fructose-1,6-bisphosphatase/inositol monophosphatase family enzyme [Planctomycetota bacterium]|jgi:fructose-1,6-bisphosphatase/inositol monophosphatase family enzyme